jgi:hypothetical protein
MVTSLLIFALCCWRVTHLLNAEDGPGKILVHLRRLAGTGLVGQLLDCFYCLSLWIALPLAALSTSSWRAGVPMWLAISGAAILLERATNRQPVVHYYEESEETHELLRKGETERHIPRIAERES